MTEKRKKKTYKTLPPSNFDPCSTWPEDVWNVISEMIMAFAEAWCLMGCAKLREMVQLTSSQGFNVEAWHPYIYMAYERLPMI